MDSTSTGGGGGGQFGGGGYMQDNNQFGSPTPSSQEKKVSVFTVD